MAVVLGFASGCAAVTFRPGVQAAGGSEDASKVVEAAMQLPPGSAEDVKVLVQTLPEGMRAARGRITYDHDRYVLLGKVNATYNSATLANVGLWFYDYSHKESWKRGYCAWQVPLSWVTGTVWSFLPFYYPCRVSFGEESDRRDAIVEVLQRATKALGGNLVIVSGFGGIDFIRLNARTLAVVASDEVSHLQGQGYAFLVKSQDVHVATSEGSPVALR